MLWQRVFREASGLKVRNLILVNRALCVGSWADVAQCWWIPKRTKQLPTVAFLLYWFLSCWCLETSFTHYQPCILLLAILRNAGGSGFFEDPATSFPGPGNEVEDPGKLENQEKNSGVRTKIQTNLNQHMTPGLEFKPTTLRRSDAYLGEGGWGVVQAIRSNWQLEFKRKYIIARWLVLRGPEIPFSRTFWNFFVGGCSRTLLKETKPPSAVCISNRFL